MPPRLRQFYKFVWWDFLGSGRVLGAFKGSQNTRNVAAQFPRLKVAHESYQSSDYQSAITLCSLVQAVRAARFRSCGSK
jgi:uncharacterized protein (DUF1330 family)